MKTIYDKIWERHLVRNESGRPSLIYIDLHLIHEVTTPQAFEGLRMHGRKVRRPELTFGTIDHAIPTIDRDLPFADPVAAKQVETLRRNAKEFGVRIYDLDAVEQGIIHVFGPEQGLTHPGMTIVCGDSHTSTHGAFGSLAFGIGTSEVEHVLATQCSYQRKSKNFRLNLGGVLPDGVTAKDLILHVIKSIGISGGTGHVFEYAGSAVENMSMEGRMTVCNMSIEAGARAGLIAPDNTTFEYLKGRAHAPKADDWEKAVDRWSSLPSDSGAVFDKELSFDVSDAAPMVTWGTSPAMSIDITETLPELPDSGGDRQSFENAYKYMGLEPGRHTNEIAIDKVFIGSCTNARIEDLRAAAKVARGYKVADGLRALVVPGSMRIKEQAEEEGLARVFVEAGFEWRDAGCSMCLGMNEDILLPGERCASTSNRNFEGRQGRGGRTHLVSPPMAAAAAVEGHFVDVREWNYYG